MRIFPQDLGPRWHPKLIQMRSSSGEFVSESTGPLSRDLPAPRMGLLGRLWAWGTGLSRAEAERALPAGVVGLVASMWVPLGIGGFVSLILTALISKGKIPGEPGWLFVALVAAAAAAAGVFLPGVTFRRYHQQPVRPGEAEVLAERAYEESDRAFLRLVRDATRQQGPAGTEESIRRAIRSLAEALERLPVVPADPVDAAALRAEATELLRRAAGEPDPVTAQSLERRARAILHRVETNERSALLARRSEALRSEIDAQMAALREGLAALQLHSPDAASLTSLADAATQMAGEATHVAAAREELDAALARVRA